MPKPFNGYGFADLVASRRCAPAHCALPNRINNPVAQDLRIWLRHSCWPPPSQQVESEPRRFGNLEGYVRSLGRGLGVANGDLT